jgi:hypothetical protein
MGMPQLIISVAKGRTMNTTSHDMLTAISHFIDNHVSISPLLTPHSAGNGTLIKTFTRIDGNGIVFTTDTCLVDRALAEAITCILRKDTRVLKAFYREGYDGLMFTVVGRGDDDPVEPLLETLNGISRYFAHVKQAVSTAFKGAA